VHKGSGKSATIVLNVIQRLAGNRRITKGFVIVEDKAKVLEMNRFEKIWKNSNLEVYGVHDKGDME
jgi:hypothetical protein